VREVKRRTKFVHTEIDAKLEKITEEITQEKCIVKLKQVQM
jgi:hypothetical protein